MPQKVKSMRLTPRQLIKHHMLYPDQPITDQDIENLVLDIPVIGYLGQNEQASSNEADKYSHK